MSSNDAEILHGEVSFHVYYEDTDFSGFVYHANYLRFFERAREHLFGIENLRALYENGLHFVVVNANVDFLTPAKHGDLLTIVTRCPVPRGATIEFQQEAVIRGTAGSEGDRRIVAGTIRAATLDRNNRPVRPPVDFMRERLSLDLPRP